MKQFLLLTLSLFAVRTFGQTPITLDRTDFPRPTPTSPLPDSVLYTNVPLTGNAADVNTTGASSVWNVTPLKNGSAAYQHFIPMSATPLIFQLAFLSCDYAQPLLGNSGLVGNLPLTDAFEYYNYSSSDTRLEIKGFGAYVDIGGTPLPLPALYSSPDVLYRFPLNYGDTDSSVSGFEVTLPLGAPIGDVTIKRNQQRVNEVDGWGSITTPAGLFDVLRVKSTIQRVDSIITVILPLGFPSTPVEYKWLGKTKKIPVFNVTGNDFAGNFTPAVITYWGQEAAFDHSLTPVESSRIYPNPATGNCTLEYTLESQTDIAVFIVNIKGEVSGQFHFKGQKAGKHNELIPVNLLPSGLYSIIIQSGNRQIITKLLKI